MNLPLVSIIIPVYNGSNYLAEAIDSALSQTYKNIEIIVVNDGSTDAGNTEKIALSYGNKIRYFSKENGGVSSALNLGIKSMKGEYFSWLSHDDIYLPNKIASQIEFINKNPQAKLVATDFIIKEEGSVKTMTFRCDNFRVINNGRQLLSTWVFACTMLVHRSCFDKVGLFNENYKMIQDLEMQLRLIKETPCYVLDDILLIMRDHSAQVTKKHREKHFYELDQLIRSLLDNFTVDFFSNEKIMNKKTLYNTYIWIGDYAIRCQTFKMANSFYRKALTVYPFSPLLLFQSLIGLKIWYYFRNLHK